MRDLTETILFWAATALGAAALFLIFVNMWMSSGNAERQAEIAQRAQVVAAATERSRAMPLVHDLVIAAQKEQNTAVRALLAKYGIPYQQPAEPAAPAQAAPPPPAKK
jgi:hypothetical protein